MVSILPTWRRLVCPSIGYSDALRCESYAESNDILFKSPNSLICRLKSIVTCSLHFKPSVFLAEGFDNDFNEIPDGLVQPLIIEDTHVQCLVPVMQGDEPNAGAVFNAFVGDEGDTHAVGDQIQCGPGGIHGTNHGFIRRRTGSPFLEAAAYIVIKYNLPFANHILGIDKIPISKRMGQGK